MGVVHVILKSGAPDILYSDVRIAHVYEDADGVDKFLCVVCRNGEIFHHNLRKIYAWWCDPYNNNWSKIHICLNERCSWESIHMFELDCPVCHSKTMIKEDYEYYKKRSLTKND